MKLERILPFARRLLELAVQPGDPVVDATVGNGHDTLFLANLTGSSGRVYGFDIQESALASCRTKLLEQSLLERVTLFLAGHEHAEKLIPAHDHGKITAAIFNLGYLPGGDKSIVTTPSTTITAINQLLQIMAPEGIIVLVIYPGHPEGAFERDELLGYLKSLDQNDFHVAQYTFLNQKNNPPFIVAVEKK